MKTEKNRFLGPVSQRQRKRTQNAFSLGSNPRGAKSLFKIKEGDTMTNENLVKELKDRYRRFLSNGRNSESFGIMRKLRRKINRAKAGIAIA